MKVGGINFGHEIFAACSIERIKDAIIAIENEAHLRRAVAGNRINNIAVVVAAILLSTLVMMTKHGIGPFNMHRAFCIFIL